MKIRTRITLLFTVITASILLIFATVIFVSAKENREKEFYSLLKKEGITKANLFFNAKVDAQSLQDIYRNNRETLNEVEVAIYDKHFNLLYHDAVDIDVVKETPEMINEIYDKGEIKYYQNHWQVIGFRYGFLNKDYIITAAAYDQYGFAKLNNLLKSMIAIFFLSIAFIYAAGHYFSKKAFDPVREMTAKAKLISATNLDLRLNEHDAKDELSELANTFNQMLARLENSFDAQKNFVYNISHELRTPLAAIISELELSNYKDLKKSDYQTAIRQALHDAKKLTRLSNSLLDLAKASYDPSEISFKPIRVDEVLVDAMQEIQQANPDFNIHIQFDQEPEQEHQISVYGNEYLLKVAFINLIENGCKFSNDKSVFVSISHRPSEPEDMTLETNAISSFINLKFKDQGIGISEYDLRHLFKPFYRGENRQFAAGNGIGLYLTQKIIHLHRGNITVQSQELKGTTFILDLPTRT